MSPPFFLTNDRQTGRSFQERSNQGLRFKVGSEFDISLVFESDRMELFNSFPQQIARLPRGLLRTIQEFAVPHSRGRNRRRTSVRNKGGTLTHPIQPDNPPWIFRLSRNLTVHDPPVCSPHLQRTKLRGCWEVAKPADFYCAIMLLT